MSLEVAAKHLAAHGRHGDSTLVHMSPNEVAGLQALARSKGKSLSRNPHTGLPEAFDLGQELGNATSGIGATVTGAALAIAFPELAAMGYTIPAIVGGTHYATTGNAGESVMGAVGAYGGQNVAGNVMQSGATTTSENAIAEAKAAAEAGASEEEQQAIIDKAMGQSTGWNNAAQGAKNWWENPTVAGLGGWKTLGMAAAPAILGAMKPKAAPTSAQNPQMIRPYTFDYNAQYGHPSNPPITASYVPGQDTSERQWFAPTYTAQTPYKAANGGIVALAVGGMAAGGGPVEQMSNNAAIGANTMYPMANMTTSAFATPYQDPRSTNMMSAMAPSGGGTVDAMSGEPNMQGTRLAAGGLSDLGGYSDGGRLLRGPGDGVSDSIPAQISQHQPARLADGEFVVPARIVSELGNGSTEAGAKQLYKMLDRVQNARAKTTGKSKVAKNTNAAKYLPA
jgi:hypothetical protein